MIRANIAFRILTVSVSESSGPHDSVRFVGVSGTTGIPLKEESEQLAGKPTRDFKIFTFHALISLSLWMGKNLWLLRMDKSIK